MDQGDYIKLIVNSVLSNLIEARCWPSSYWRCF